MLPVVTLITDQEAAAALTEPPIVGTGSFAFLAFAALPSVIQVLCRPAIEAQTAIPTVVASLPTHIALAPTPSVP
jgi:hypothetical protein